MAEMEDDARALDNHLRLEEDFVEIFCCGCDFGFIGWKEVDQPATALLAA